ncbi:heterokaryon incompatibility protein-domain-containing protein [Rostrohypoxylon terebratum]|nr:heterokaryon incompatibility protein-domain-containing protein [Rostrohypoxylon terebratum]
MSYGGCDICETFVSGLKIVYQYAKEGRIVGHNEIQWEFQDTTPSLPGLTQSAARGCPWCAILNDLLTVHIRNDLINHNGNGKVSFTIVCDYDESKQNSAPLRGIYSMRIKSSHPARSDERCYIHVVQDKGLPSPWMINIKKMRKALDTCVNTHGRCPGCMPRKSPLRLLDVGDENFIKLVEPHDKRLTYAALSYCWGKTPINRTTKLNVEARMYRFYLSELPRTLQDAIALTRHLKIQYIWIDAICIVQDCTTEWTKEAQKMMEYYAHACMTIVPVESTCADSGMNWGYDTLYRKFRGPWTTDFRSNLILSTARGRPSYGPDGTDSPAWDTRGWTYQEKLNSSRIIMVYQNGIMFLRCRETYVCSHRTTLEQWPSGDDRIDFLPYSNFSLSRLSFGTREKWYGIVEDFSRRAVTLPKDRWFAFLGIARAFEKASGHTIVAGLWKDRILEDIVSWNPKPRVHTVWLNLPARLVNSTSSGPRSPPSPTWLSHPARLVKSTSSRPRSTPSPTWLKLRRSLVNSTLFRRPRLSPYSWDNVVGNIADVFKTRPPEINSATGLPIDTSYTGTWQSSENNRARTLRKSNPNTSRQFTSTNTHYGLPTCRNCGKTTSCIESPGEGDSSRPSLPSWTWLNTEKSDEEHGNGLRSRRVELDEKPFSKILQVMGDDRDISSCKLSISGAILYKVEMLELVRSCLRNGGGHIECPQRGRGIMFLDNHEKYIEMCDYDNDHSEDDSSAYHAFCSLWPAASALLVGPGYFRSSAELFWHFILIQPTQEFDGGDGLLPLECRRIGTMHIPNRCLISRDKRMLRALQREKLILV